MTRVIRFFFDHGHPWPLWESGTESYTMTPADYGLSEELTERLRSAHELWRTHRDLEGTWSSPGARARWREETDQALAVLRREVGDVADVRDERGL